ncbi:MAG: diguanylate cyclase response regulator [Deltaproteobacteria bacterium]|nr:MAG: diguanylate cyclase response regulator [Deltaproteobacteria bacterium]
MNPGQDKDNIFSILIVDDDPVSRLLLEKILKKEGFKVCSAEDGVQALDIFKRQYIPIVLTDWMMPKMNGLELCRALRSIDSPGYIFIIIITAKDSKEDIVHGLEAGADDYVSKPFHHAELLARIRTGIRILELEKSLRKANKEIRRLSITDPLTGCFNRGYLMDFLPKEIKRSIRYNHPLSIIMCDIDHFKNVNDTYGHQAGDIALKSFVKILNSSVREGSDWLARYGGEEFLMVLPETDLEGAIDTAERLRKRVAKNRIEIGEDKKITITASFGVATFNPVDTKKEITSDSLINMADNMLYKAKSEGRNRVEGILV